MQSIVAQTDARHAVRAIRSYVSADLCDHDMHVRMRVAVQNTRSRQAIASNSCIISMLAGIPTYAARVKIRALKMFIIMRSKLA